MASKKTALSVEHVSMKFNLSSQKVDNIKEYVIKMLKKELMYLLLKEILDSYSKTMLYGLI